MAKNEVTNPRAKSWRAHFPVNSAQQVPGHLTWHLSSRIDEMSTYLSFSSGNLVKGWTSCDEHPLSSLPVEAGEIRSSSLCRSHRELIADSPPSPTPLSFITTRVTTSDDACSIWDAWMTFRYRYVEEERKKTKIKQKSSLIPIWLF